MKAVMIDRFGGNDVVRIRDVPSPEPKPGQILVRVRAAGVNPVDWKIRDGHMRLFTGRGFPMTLGSECSGEIVSIHGSGSNWSLGDEVIVYPGVRNLGAYAEYVAVVSGSLFRKPAGVAFEEAATIPISGVTALQALRDKGKVGLGSKVLINGASGGVGHYAIQIAKILGAEVTGVSSRRNLDFVTGLGADRVVDYDSEDFVRMADEYDVIFDTVSRRTFRECRKVLLNGGIYIATLPSVSVIMNQYLTGYLSRKKACLIAVAPNPFDVAWVADRVKIGKIRVVLDRVFMLEGVKDALSYSEAHRTRGKVVLKIS